MLVSLVLVALLAVRVSTLMDFMLQEWPELLFWALLIGVLNLFPIRVGDRALVLDQPLLIAVAMIYPAEVAATVTLLGATDTREFRREVTLQLAIFNRVQVALTVFVVAFAFKAVGGSLDPWPIATLGTAFAVTVNLILNVLLVSVHDATAGKGFRRTLMALRVGKPSEFLLTSFSYAVLALVVARVFVDVGAWAVVVFLIPAMIARQALARAQSVEQMADDLRDRGRMLENALGRLEDERADERLRIAGDLHDDIQQELLGIALLAQSIEKQIKHGKAELSDIRDLVSAVDGSVDTLRQVIHDLKESPLGKGGLNSTLRNLIRDLRLDWKTPIELHLVENDALPPHIQVLIYQVARESILNALRHAQARSIHVRLFRNESDVTLAISDDGVGFRRKEVNRETHFGLSLMEERVRRAGGQSIVRTTIGAGTTITVTVPAEGSSSSDLDLRSTRG
ncbi:MAG: sensor histidine kinase [Actinomycetota bacterium]